ncbi:MAG: OsmC family protein [Gemmatimonadaceae bacterium]|nr:OsmC family protein [Gemmatimonadaceae bacterium]
MQRTAQAVWNGTGLEGSGTLTTLSGAMKEQPYSFKLRFQDEHGTEGTNPEELIAAAHAGCFSMALSFGLTNAGHPPTQLQTKAVLTMEKQPIGFTIVGIVLKVTGTVAGITAERFVELAEAAKAGCPISRALNVPISLEASLTSA